jgi:hypothetical protein
MLRLVVGLVLLWSLASAPAEAVVEARCVELGANCLCSEQFNATAYTRVQDKWQPADTETTTCEVEATMTNAAISTGGASDIISRNDVLALGRIPNRDASQVQRYLSRNAGHEGTWNIGHGAFAMSHARIELRIYRYITSDAGLAGDSPCFNSKWTQHPNDQKIDFDSSGAFHLYNYFQGSPSFDCCGAGTPMAVNANPPSRTQLKGKWWRESFVETNRGGPGWRLEHFMKNITDNTPEVSVIDSTGPGPNQSQRQQWVPASPMNKINMNNHRAGGCPGWYGFRNLVAAGWSTNAGQRIGAAVEMEGGGVPAMNAPTNLRGCPGAGCTPSGVTADGVGLLAVIVTIAAMRWRRRA